MTGVVPRRRITLERQYRAPIRDVWDLWTTKEGIESWWGPAGFAVAVHDIDLRPGGILRYAMTAVDAPQIAFMRRIGRPLTTEARMKFTEVVPRSRLAFVQIVDFIPGVATYEAGIEVDIHRSPNGVRMVLTIEAMHDEEWTARAVAGWESELGKLERLFAGG